MKVRLTKKLRKHEIGEVLDLPRRHAKLLVAIKRATVHEDQPEAMSAPPEPVVAEPVAQEPVNEETEATESAEDEPEISPRTGLPKRQYRRRDMTAEG